MLTLSEKAREQLQAALGGGEMEQTRLRVFIDHRCHCGKAHFSLALAEAELPDDMPFDVSGIPFIADSRTVPELPHVEINYIETQWTTGFTIRNVDHQCGPHMMQ